MKKIIYLTWAGVFSVLLALSCNPKGDKRKTMQNNKQKEYPGGSYGYDVDFFGKNGIETIELTDTRSEARVLVVPAYQGRVMTSSADGPEGMSFGWINYKLIESGEVSDQFNPFGGEERLWLGPEGGPFSIYFGEKKEQVFPNWKVPSFIDTEPFELVCQDSAEAKFSKKASFSNASGTDFHIGISRQVSLLSMEVVSSVLNVEIPSSLRGVAYRTDNTIQNIGSAPMTRDGGLLSIWLLSMFNPTESTTVFIPYKTGLEGAIVNDDYFGKVPANRLLVEEGIIYFRIDGKHRSKIGIPFERAMPLCGSYDAENSVLTLLWFNLPDGPHSYVNSKWGPQADPYNGDVVNSYNDGPLDDGSIMGPFYELESSSPGAELKPSESLTHSQMIIHLLGNETDLSKLVTSLFGPELSEIKSKFI